MIDPVIVFSFGYLLAFHFKQKCVWAVLVIPCLITHTFLKCPKVLPTKPGSAPRFPNVKPVRGAFHPTRLFSVLVTINASHSQGRKL